MQHCTIRSIAPTDLISMLDILNFYALNTTADFSEKPHDLADIRSLIYPENGLPKYVAEINNEVIGFALAYPFRPEHTFAHSVKFTYWIKPSFVGQGIGTNLYQQLEADCKQKGITNILVNISSENNGSLRFHESHGFVTCGHFRNVASKFGRLFDMIWMQKSLS